VGALAPNAARLLFGTGGGRDRLGAGVAGLGERTGPRGGQKTGNNPTDSGKQGSKRRRRVVERGGVPLALNHSAANVHDSKMVEEMVEEIQPVRGSRGRPGRPRKRPKKLHADKG